MDIDAGDRADPRARDDRRAFGRAARHARALDAGRKALRGHATVLDIEDGAEDDDLAVEPAPEIVLVVLDGARAQIGKREGRDVVGAAFEIQRHRVRHPARYRVARKRHPAALVELRRGAQRPCRQFDCHGRHLCAVEGKGQRQPTHDVVAVGMVVERPDVLLLAHRDALSRRGHDRAAAQNFAQHHLALGRRAGKRAQEVAVETADLFAQHAVPERNLGLLERVRNHHVEAGDPGAAFERCSQHAADLAGPGQHRRTLEGCGAQALLVHRDDDGRRGGRVVSSAEYLPAQRGEDVDGEAADRPDDGRNRSRRADQRDGGDHKPVARGAPYSQDGFLRMACPTRLFHAEQAADDRRRTGLGLRIDPEHDFART